MSSPVRVSVSRYLSRHSCKYTGPPETPTEFTSGIGSVRYMYALKVVEDFFNESIEREEQRGEILLSVIDSTLHTLPYCKKDK